MFNHKSILHIQDSQYCYALNENTVKVTLRTDSDDTFDEVNLIYGNKYDYYLVRKKAVMKKTFTDAFYDYYTVTLKLDDVRFVYIFELVHDGKPYYFSEDGLSETYDFAFAYYNSFQLPYINRIDVMPTVEWMKNAVFYEIFVDRFNSADKKPEGYVTLKWGDKPTNKSFAGGDLRGIIKKLDYLKNLGVTALYLTPIFTSVSNHKYDISDYLKIDPAFGNEETFKELVEEAHKRGIKIVLDAVFNHCSENLAQFKDVVKKGRASEYYNWFVIRGDEIKDGNYEYFGVCKYMPKFNTSDENVQKFLIGIATHWIKNYGIDGWRLDVSDEVSHDFWRHFREEVKRVKKDCVILGENWHDSYPYLKGDQFDGIMNYALTKACMDYFANGSLDAEGFAKRLSGLYVRNTRQVNSMMLNLLDSHDTHRFYTLVNENKDKLACALAVIYMHTGSALIYYGTEVPLAGGYDPDCRRTMDWNIEKNHGVISELCKKLASVRQDEIIAEGDISFCSHDGLFVLERRFNNDRLKLTVNDTGKPVKVNLEGRDLASHNYCGGVLDKFAFVIEKIQKEDVDG